MLGGLGLPLPPPLGPPATVPNGNVVQGPTEEAQGEEPLPVGWEMRYDMYGRRYYVDHNTRYVLLNYFLLFAAILFNKCSYHLDYYFFSFFFVFFCKTNPNA